MRIIFFQLLFIIGLGGCVFNASPQACAFDQVRTIQSGNGVGQTISASIYGKTCANAVYKIDISSRENNSIFSYSIPMKELWRAPMPSNVSADHLEEIAKNEAALRIRESLTISGKDLRLLALDRDSCEFPESGIVVDSAVLLVKPTSFFSMSYLVYDPISRTYREIGDCAYP